MATFKKPEDAETPLGQLLLKTVPPNDLGNRTFTHLAELIPMSRYGLQKWLAKQRVPPSKVDRLVAIGRIGAKDKSGRVSRADFEPFVYNFPEG